MTIKPALPDIACRSWVHREHDGIMAGVLTQGTEDNSEPDRRVHVSGPVKRDGPESCISSNMPRHYRFVRS
jgi:hypothetical protein